MLQERLIVTPSTPSTPSTPVVPPIILKTASDNKDNAPSAADAGAHNLRAEKFSVIRACGVPLKRVEVPAGCDGFIAAFETATFVEADAMAYTGAYGAYYVVDLSDEHNVHLFDAVIRVLNGKRYLMAYRKTYLAPRHGGRARLRRRFIYNMGIQSGYTMDAGLAEFLALVYLAFLMNKGKAIHTLLNQPNTKEQSPDTEEQASNAKEQLPNTEELSSRLSELETVVISQLAAINEWLQDDTLAVVTVDPKTGASSASQRTISYHQNDLSLLYTGRRKSNKLLHKLGVPLAGEQQLSDKK